MAALFISYRRSDSLPWAGRLFDHLSRHFGKRQVFMDINGGIPRGADFERVLREALAGCDALLALIGPSWLDCRRKDGQRRLDVPEDWVRNEIVAGLTRGVPVVPVLFGGAVLPAEADLPEELRLLSKRQQAVMADTDWAHHVRQLISDLLLSTSLELVSPLERDDVDSASSGIQALSALVSSRREVADAVARSKEVVATTYQRLERLEMFKNLHDTLHTIEFECLRPLQAGDSTVRLRPFRSRFLVEANRMRSEIDGRDLNPALRDDLIDGLDATELAFRTAIEQPDEAAFARLVGELNALLSSLPPRLDVGISEAARELNLDRLIELMSTVRATQTGAAADPKLAQFLEGIDALKRLRDQLAQRVQEHTQLQRLDSKLRAVCVGGVAAGVLGAEWGRIKLVRARLLALPSAEMQAAAEDLAAVEGEIDQAIARSDEMAAFDLVREYFRLVASVFRDVDRALKGFCLQLGAVSQPLKTILDLV